ncbi:MAG: hypothetical protein AAGB31_13190 [Bdellovibrio sp.]
MLLAWSKWRYNYYVSLMNGWKFERSNNKLIVHVPELSSSAPAVNVSKLKWTVQEGSVLRNHKVVLESLQKDLQSLLVDSSIQHRDLVREEARKAIHDFVTSWLTTTAGQEVDIPVVIYFPQENTQKISP